MNFSELIGAPIFVAFRGTESSEPSFLRVKLVGVEHSGIWVDSDKLRSFFQQELWAEELEQYGPEGVGKTSIEHFIPFSTLRYVLALREK